MDIKKFIKLRPFLYHLTDCNNINTIIESKSILSTKKIVENSEMTNKDEFLRSRRSNHNILSANGVNYKIRDQKPISIKTLSKCLTDQWVCSDFIEHINKRVFFWCTLNRLSRHFDRYKNEKPIILRCQTKDIIINSNNSTELCRLNSGATRASHHWGGIAPPRGPNTFQNIKTCELTPGQVVEVTFLEQCNLEGNLFISNDPEGPWKLL